MLGIASGLAKGNILVVRLPARIGRQIHQVDRRGRRWHSGWLRSSGWLGSNSWLGSGSWLRRRWWRLGRHRRGWYRRGRHSRLSGSSRRDDVYSLNTGGGQAAALRDQAIVGRLLRTML